jgi:hypothetical protein
VDRTSSSEALVDEIARRHPDRVTILLEEMAPEEWASDDSEDGQALRDRLAALLTTIEQRTGAAVVGLAGDSEQLEGWRFDRVIGGQLRVSPAVPA